MTLENYGWFDKNVKSANVMIKTEDENLKLSVHLCGLIRNGCNINDRFFNVREVFHKIILPCVT